MPLRQPTDAFMSWFRGRQGTIAHPHIVEFNKTFITPLTRSDGLDITKLLEFATNFIVIDRLTGSRIPQGDNQSALNSLV